MSEEIYCERHCSAVEMAAPTAPTVTSIKDDSDRIKQLEKDIGATNFDAKFSDNFWRIDDVKLVENELLSTAFLDAKNEISSKGRSHDELTEVLVFSVENERRIGEICRKGPKVGLKKRHVLGYTGSGIHMVRHYDVLTRYMAFQQFVSPSIVVVYKCILGKQKPVYPRLHKDDNYVLPNLTFDCHISSRPVEPKMPICEALNCSYVYLFQLGKTSHPVKYPQQILPYAVLTLQKKHPVHISYAMCAVGQSEDSPKWEVKGETRSGYRYNFIKPTVRHRSKPTIAPSSISTLKGQLLEMRSKVRDSPNDKSPGLAGEDTNIKWNGHVIDETHINSSMKPFVKLKRLQPFHSESFRRSRCREPIDSTNDIVDTKLQSSIMNTLSKSLEVQDNHHCFTGTAVKYITHDKRVTNTDETGTESIGNAKIMHTDVENNDCDKEAQLSETISLPPSFNERSSPTAAASAPETLNICPTICEAKLTDLEPGMAVSGSYLTAVEVSTQAIQNNVGSSFGKHTPIAQTKCIDSTEDCTENPPFANVSQNAVRTLDKYCEDFKEPLRIIRKQRQCIEVSKGATLHDQKEQCTVGRIDESTALRVRHYLSEKFRSVNMMKHSDYFVNKVQPNNDTMPDLDYFGKDKTSYSNCSSDSDGGNVEFSRTDNGLLKAENTPPSICQDNDSQDTIIYGVNVSNSLTCVDFAGNKLDKKPEHLSESGDSNDSDTMPRLFVKNEPIENSEHVISSSTDYDWEPDTQLNEQDVINETEQTDTCGEGKCFVLNCDIERGEENGISETSSTKVNSQTVEIKSESEVEIDSNNRIVILTCSSLNQNGDQNEASQIHREKDKLGSVSTRSDSTTLLDRSERDTHDLAYSNDISIKMEACNDQQATDLADICDGNKRVQNVESQDHAQSVQAYKATCDVNKNVETVETVETQVMTQPDHTGTCMLAKESSSIFGRFKSLSPSKHHSSTIITKTLSEMTSSLDNMRKKEPHCKLKKHIRNKQEIAKTTMRETNDKTLSIDHQMGNSKKPHYRRQTVPSSGNNQVKKQSPQTKVNIHTSAIKRKNTSATSKQPSPKKQKLNNTADKSVCSKSATQTHIYDKNISRKNKQVVSRKTLKTPHILNSSKQPDSRMHSTRSFKKYPKKNNDSEASTDVGVNTTTNEMRNENICQNNVWETREKDMQEPKNSTLLKLAPGSNRPQHSLQSRSNRTQVRQEDYVERRKETGGNTRNENRNQFSRTSLKSSSNKCQVLEENVYPPNIEAAQNDGNTTVKQVGLSISKNNNACANENAFTLSELPEHSSNRLMENNIPFSPELVLDKNHSEHMNKETRPINDENEVLIESRSKSKDIQNVGKERGEPKTVNGGTNATANHANEGISMKHNATANGNVVTQSELPPQSERDVESSSLPSAQNQVANGHQSGSMAKISKPHDDKCPVSTESHLSAISIRNRDVGCVDPGTDTDRNATILTPNPISEYKSSCHTAWTNENIIRRSGLLENVDRGRLIVSSTLPSSPEKVFDRHYSGSVVNATRQRNGKIVTLGHTSEAVSTYHYAWANQPDKRTKSTISFKNYPKKDNDTEASKQDGVTTTTTEVRDTTVCQDNIRTTREKDMQEPKTPTLLKLAPGLNRTQTPLQSLSSGTQVRQKDSVERRKEAGGNTRNENRNRFYEKTVNASSNTYQVRQENGHLPKIKAAEIDRNETVNKVSVSLSNNNNAWTNENAFTQLPEHSSDRLMAEATLQFSPEHSLDDNHSGPVNKETRPINDKNDVLIGSRSQNRGIQNVGEDRSEPKTVIGGTYATAYHATKHISNEGISVKHNATANENVITQSELLPQSERDMVSSSLPSAHDQVANVHQSGSMAKTSKPHDDKCPVSIESHLSDDSIRNIDEVCVDPSKSKKGYATVLTPDPVSEYKSSCHTAWTNENIIRKSGLQENTDRDRLMVSSTWPASPVKAFDRHHSGSVVNASRQRNDNSVPLGPTSKAETTYHYAWTSNNVVTQSGLLEHTDKDRMLVSSTLPSSSPETVFGGVGSLANTSRPQTDKSSVSIESYFNTSRNRAVGQKNIEQNKHTEGNNIILTLDNASEAVSTYHYALENENVITQSDLPEHIDRDMLMVSSTLPSSPEFDGRHSSHIDNASRQHIDKNSVTGETYPYTKNIQNVGEDMVEPGMNTSGDNLSWNYTNETLRTTSDTWSKNNVTQQFDLPETIDQYLMSMALGNGIPSSEYIPQNNSGSMNNVSQMEESGDLISSTTKRTNKRNLRRRRLKEAKLNFLSTESMQEFLEWQKFKREQRIRKQINDALSEYQRTGGDSTRLLNDLTRHKEFEEDFDAVHVDNHKFPNKGTSTVPSRGRNKIFYSKYISSQRNKFDQHAKGVNFRKQAPFGNRRNYILRKTRTTQIARFQQKPFSKDPEDKYSAYSRDKCDHRQPSTYDTHYLKKHRKTGDYYDKDTAGYTEKIGSTLQYESDSTEKERIRERRSSGHSHGRTSTYSSRKERGPTIIENGTFVQRRNYYRNSISEERDNTDHECQVKRLKTDHSHENRKRVSSSTRDKCRRSGKEPVGPEYRDSYKISRESRKRTTDAPRTNNKDRKHESFPYDRKKHTDRSKYSRDTSDYKYDDRHDYYRQSDKSYDRDGVGKSYTDRVKTTSSGSGDDQMNNDASYGGYLVQEKVSYTSLSMAIDTFCNEARQCSDLPRHYDYSKAAIGSGQPIPVISSKTYTQSMQYPYPSSSSR